MITFTKLQWEDFIAQYPNRFKITDNKDGTFTIEDEPGNIIQNGTPVNAVNLNRIENGIEALANEDSKNLKKSNNLSEIKDKAAARLNLGLGSLAVMDNTSVLYKTNNLSDLTDKVAARTNLGLGNIATMNSASFLVKSSNLSDVSSPATARTNLGLRSAATKNITFSKNAPMPSELLEGDLWFVYAD